VSEPSRVEATDQLISRVQELVAKLQAEQEEPVPAGEPYLASGSALKGSVKRGVFRATRPATRRYDRLATELANVAVELAVQLQAANADIDRLRGDIDRLDRAVGSLRSSVAVGGEGERGPGSSSATGQVPDDYYWAFEERMRGSSASVLDRLRRYERLAVPLRESFHADADGGTEPPLWLDLGCGLGEFCELVREWGWRVEGVDSSPGAVEACRTKDIDATLADVSEFLATRRGEMPGAISAIQLIEHLPRGGWIELFERAHALLSPGGALLVETINGLNPEAVTSYFLADITHTWPGHPETLTLMAEHAGFVRVEVIFCNPDQRGNAQDFAIWAHKGDPDP
jgi:predicted TPR repeat methyltransferase